MKKGELFVRFPELLPCEDEIEKLICEIVRCHKNGGKILLCGNGGSAADCEHISGELLKGFLLKRHMSDETAEKFRKNCPDGAEKLIETLQGGIAAIPLPALTGVGTAYSNDADASLVFAQEVFALGREGDLLIGISTSGNSENVTEALKTARALGITTAALTGEGIGKTEKYSDIKIHVPARETYRVQEYHLPVYHYICARAEEIIFG